MPAAYLRRVRPSRPGARAGEAGSQADKIVVTDGVFSMDGILRRSIASRPLRRARRSAGVDDSHATGFVGEHGRGTGEYFGVKPDVISSTLARLSAAPVRIRFRPEGSDRVAAQQFAALSVLEFPRAEPGGGAMRRST